MKKLQNAVLLCIVIGAVCLGMASTSGVQEKGYEALLGEWDVQTEDGQYAFVFIFSVEEDVLKGIFKGSTGEYEMKDLSFDGKDVQFTVNIDAGGQTMTIDYSAAVDGDSLEGYLSMEYGEANITGKKRK